jgi:hypothetical protein
MCYDRLSHAHSLNSNWLVAPHLLLLVLKQEELLGELRATIAKLEHLEHYYHYNEL